MNELNVRAPWLANGRDEWLHAVARWIGGELGIDLELRSLVPVTLRPWGAVLRASTAVGVVIFKAVGSHGRHETTLLADIGDHQANLTPEMLAVDHHDAPPTGLQWRARLVSLAMRGDPGLQPIAACSAHG